MEKSNISNAENLVLLLMSRCWITKMIYSALRILRRQKSLTSFWPTRQQNSDLHFWADCANCLFQWRSEDNAGTRTISLQSPASPQVESHQTGPHRSEPPLLRVTINPASTIHLHRWTPVSRHRCCGVWPWALAGIADSRCGWPSRSGEGQKIRISRIESLGCVLNPLSAHRRGSPKVIADFRPLSADCTGLIARQRCGESCLKGGGSDSSALRGWRGKFAKFCFGRDSSSSIHQNAETSHVLGGLFAGGMSLLHVRMPHGQTHCHCMKKISRIDLSQFKLPKMKFHWWNYSTEQRT